jgi:hypothetical protein
MGASLPTPRRRDCAATVLFKYDRAGQDKFRFAQPAARRCIHQAALRCGVFLADHGLVCPTCAEVHALLDAAARGETLQA